MDNLRRGSVLDGDQALMGLLSKLERGAAELKAYEARQSFSLSDTNQKLGGWFGGYGTATGKNVNENSALQVTAFFACIRLLAETMGAMPSAIFAKEKNGNAARAEDHPLHEVLVEQPNSDMNGVEYREASTSNLAARGNTYSIIERRSSGDLISLYPVATARVQIKRDESTNFEIRYGINDRGKQEWYPSEKIWHRRGFSFDGLIGLSPLQCAREAIGLSLAGEEFNARLFGQGLVPSALVSIPQWLTDEQRIIADKKLLEMHTGAQNLRKPMLLEGGMKVEAGLMTPDDAQFLQLRQFTVIEICRMLGVKPHMIAALERATDNNIEKLSAEFVTYTMLPHMIRDEKAARQLLKPADKNKFFYRYNAEGLLRADSAARAALYSILLQNGVVNRNHVRSKEGLNTVDDPAMDQYTVQSNMAMIDQLAALVAARMAPPAQPAASAMPQVPEKSGDTQNINIELPAEMNHKIAQSIEIPGIKELATQVKRSNDASVDATNSLRETVTTIASSIAELKHEIGKPRKAVFDSDGNPIGVKTVDTLH